MTDVELLRDLAQRIPAKHRLILRAAAHYLVDPDGYQDAVLMERMHNEIVQSNIVRAKAHDLVCDCKAKLIPDVGMLMHDGWNPQAFSSTHEVFNSI